jgi:hypothetical protein
MIQIFCPIFHTFTSLFAQQMEQHNTTHESHRHRLCLNERVTQEQPSNSIYFNGVLCMPRKVVLL